MITINSNTLDSQSTGTISGDVTISLGDTLYCYDSAYDNTMISSSNITGSSNVFITNNTGTVTSPYWNSITDTLTLGQIQPLPLKVKGDAEIEGNLTLGGKNIGEMLSKIEERLAILHPNPELEEKWENLRALGKMYKELEQEIIEKEKIYSILKK